MENFAGFDDKIKEIFITLRKIPDDVMENILQLGLNVTTEAYVKKFYDAMVSGAVSHTGSTRIRSCCASCGKLVFEM